MNSNVLAKFEYNGKIYVYYVMPDKPKNILYGYLENDVIKEVTDPDGISIMQEAYKKIFISSDPLNYIKLETIKHRGKLMQVMLDKVSNIKFFYEIKDGKYYWPTKQDAQELFNIFYDDVLYIENVDKNKKVKRKKKLTIEKAIAILGTVIFVTIGADFLFTKYIVPEYQNVAIINKNDGSIGEFENEFREKELEQALYSNPNLTDAEKEFFKDQIPLLIKYKDVTDFDLMTYRFSTLKTEYDPELCSEDMSILGYYSPPANKIKVFNSKNFEESPKEIIGHEGEHAFSGVKDHRYLGIYEGTTVIINNEREYAETSTAYIENSGLQGILYQIIGARVFGNFEKSGDIKYIKDSLMALIPDEVLAEKLFSSLGNIILYNDEIYLREDSDEYSEKDVEESKENLANSKKTAVSIISKYFYAAKDYDMKESPVAMIYLKFANLIDDDIYLSFNSTGLELYPVYKIELKKGYFEDDYIKKYPYFKLEYSGRGVEMYKKSSFILDPSIRLIKTENGYVLNTNVDKSSLENQKSSDSFFNVVKSLYDYEQNASKKEMTPLPYGEQPEYIRILCEIIGVEPFNRYLANGDQNEIINALLEINPDVNEALNLINNINVTTSYYEDSFYDPSTPWYEKFSTDGWDINDDMYKARDQIYNSLNNYFKSVYGYPMEEDAYATMYYADVNTSFSDFYDMGAEAPLSNGLVFLDEDGNEINTGSNDFYITRRYFVADESSITDQASVKIRIYKDGNKSIKAYTLTDENRRLVASQENPGNYVFTAMPFEDEPAKGY